MELRQIETFVAIATTGSFTRAADELSLTQPAVTRQIAALEIEMKTRLFDRLGRRVALTAAGNELLRYAVPMLRLASEARSAVADVRSGGAGRLAVGASSTAATYLLPPILRRFQELHPGVELSVRTGPSPHIAELVLSNAVDLGVVMDHSEQPDLTQIELAKYAIVVVASPKDPIAQHASQIPGGEAGVGVETLAGSPLILMQHGASLRAYADTMLESHAVRANVSIVLDSVEAIKKMVEAGLGVSILPLMAVTGEVADGRLLALRLLDVPSAVQPIGLIHRDDKFLSSSMRAFSALLKAELSAGSE